MLTLPPVQLHDRPDDREAEPSALRVARPSAVDAVEAIMRDSLPNSSRLDSSTLRYSSGAPAPCQRHLRLAHQVVDGSAQLMRQISGELRQLGKGFLQPPQHLVERTRELDQLGRPCFGADAFMQLGGGDASGALGIDVRAKGGDDEPSLPCVVALLSARALRELFRQLRGIGRAASVYH
jgi:hypothetical protein